LGTLDHLGLDRFLWSGLLGGCQAVEPVGQPVVFAVEVHRDGREHDAGSYHLGVVADHVTEQLRTGLGATVDADLFVIELHVLVSW
jgi:hypothetical protein